MRITDIAEKDGI